MSRRQSYATHSRLTGQTIPRCTCGKTVYAEGKCYRCFQQSTASEPGHPDNPRSDYRKTRERF